MAIRKHSFEFMPGGELRVEQLEGVVRVQAWDQASALVQASSEDEAGLDQRLQIEHDRHSLTVKVERSRRLGLGFFSGERKSIDLEIFVPKGTRCDIDCGAGPIQVVGTHAPVEIECGSGKIDVAQVLNADLETGSGSVKARQVHGNLAVETGSGIVDVEEVHGNVSMETGSGSITVCRVHGSVEAETGSGIVTAKDVHGSADLSTGSGSINASRIQGSHLSAHTGGGVTTLEQLHVSHLEVESGSGTVKVELGSVYSGGHYQIEAGSGHVEVAIPPTADLHIAVETHNGRVSHEGLPLTAVRSEPGELEAVMGRGGARLQIEAAYHVKLVPVSGATFEPHPPHEPHHPHVPVQTPSGILRILKSDAALSNNEHIQKVLDMVAQGKLSPEEANELLGALDDEEAKA